MTTTYIDSKEKLNEASASVKYVRKLMPNATDQEIYEAVENLHEYIIVLYKWFIVEQKHLPVEQRKPHPLRAKILEDENLL